MERRRRVYSDDFSHRSCLIKACHTNCNIECTVQLPPYSKRVCTIGNQTLSRVPLTITSHLIPNTHTQPHKLLKPFQNVTLQPILQHDSRRPTRSLPTFFRKLHATTPLRLPVILQHHIDPTLMSQLDDHKYDKSIVLCLCGRGPSGL